MNILCVVHFGKKADIPKLDFKGSLCIFSTSLKPFAQKNPDNKLLGIGFFCLLNSYNEL